MVQAQSIREHMEVLGSDGRHVGTVDHMEGSDRIKLTKGDSGDGKHHFIPLDMVERVDQHVHLSKPSQDVMRNWTEH